MWLIWKKTHLRTPLRVLEKALFQQANVILMADVSVCNRDKEGASAFITIICKMLVPTA